MNCLLTGGSSGIGREALRLLAATEAAVTVTGRASGEGEAVCAQIARETGNTRIGFIAADFASLHSVRMLAAQLNERSEPIDVLINNAGIYQSHCHLTEDGFERSFAVNHLAHFLLSNLLVDLLAPGARVIVLASAGHVAGDLRRAPLDRIARGPEPWNGLRAYGNSKLANILFAFEAARRWSARKVVVNALHPGTLRTPVWAGNRDLLSRFMTLAQPFLPPARKGGERIARLATDPALAEVTGQYFNKGKPAPAAPQACDRQLAADLWDASVRWTALDTGESRT